jgi:hypothetical protein
LRFRETELYEILEIVVIKSSTASLVAAIDFSNVDGGTLVDGVEPFTDAQCVLE